jgi:glucosylglycerate synthase
MAALLEAKACAVVDSDLRSSTPEWIDLLLRPILSADFDFVAPYYHRHKYDGTITNSIVYPLTRSLYGLRVRQPIGGEFGVSALLIARYLEKDDWETDVARYGIDIWMTTIAIAEGFRVCQSFLGAKLHDAKDPSSDLSAMLEQVVGSVFLLMGKYESVWRQRASSNPVPLFGFRYDVGLEPVAVNVERMVSAFVRGCQDLAELWAMALQPETYAQLQALGVSATGGGNSFHLEDDLWARVVLDFACAFKKHPLSSRQLLQSLTPLYLGRVASFVQETQSLGSVRVEEDIERLCLAFEALKPYLIRQWDAEIPSQSGMPLIPVNAQRSEKANLEV